MTIQRLSCEWGAPATASRELPRAEDSAILPPLLTRDEVRRMAANIADLSELLSKPQTSNCHSWSVEATDACLIVRDANGQALACVYCEEEPGRRTAAKLLTRDEAQSIAASVAKLPDFLRSDYFQALCERRDGAAHPLQLMNRHRVRRDWGAFLRHQLGLQLFCANDALLSEGPVQHVGRLLTDGLEK